MIKFLRVGCQAPPASYRQLLRLTIEPDSGNILGQVGEVAQRWSSGLISQWFWVQIPASPFISFFPKTSNKDGSGFIPSGGICDHFVILTNPSLAISFLFPRLKKTVISQNSGFAPSGCMSPKADFKPYRFSKP